jgi:hypothetical protein
MLCKLKCNWTIVPQQNGKSIQRNFCPTIYKLMQQIMFYTFFNLVYSKNVKKLQ